MPDFQRRFRFQAAVLWPATDAAGGYDAYGQPLIGDPVEIRVRWVGKQSEALDPHGNTITVDATVITNRTIPIGSRMWLGAMADLPGTGSTPERDIMVVKTDNETADIRNRAKRRTAGLVRWKDRLE